MGIDKLASSIIADANKEAAEIIKAAEWHVQKMVADEKAKKPVLLKEAENEIAKRITDHEKERIAWARLEAKRILAEAREDAIKSALEEFFSMLGEIRKHKDYSKFMARSFDGALKEIGTKDVIVHVLKGDKKYLGSFSGKVLEDLSSFGGLILESADGKVRINMTVEALFESNRDAFRKKAYENLFGDGHTGPVAVKAKTKSKAKNQ